MAGGAEVTKGAFSYAGPLAGLFQGGRKALGGLTEAERAADDAQKKKIQAAEDELELKKQVAAQNNDTAQGVINQVTGQASDAEIMQIIQMMQNGMTPEEVSSTLGLGQEQGTDYSMFGGPKARAAAAAPTPQQTPAPTGSRTPVQSPAPAPSGGLRGALAKNPNIDWGSLGGPITDANGEQYTIGEDGEYRNANGERYYPADGTGFSFDGDSPISKTGVDTSYQLGDSGQDPDVQFQIDKDTQGYVPGSVKRTFGESGGNTGPFIPKGYESTAAKGGSISDYSAEDIRKASEIANKGRWSQKGEYDRIQDARMGVYDQLASALDAIKNPEAAARHKDVENAAFRSDQTKGQQQLAMNKLQGLTDVRETAEERLMREVARRNQENQMVSQRKATLGNLAARGQLGSGAELASMLGAQASTSSNRVMDEMAANANAQKRAIDALGKYGDMSLNLGGQDIQEGAEANKNNQLNNALGQQYNEYKTKTERDNNTDTAKRSATKADAGNDVLNKGEGQVDKVVMTAADLGRLKMGTATNGANLVAPAATKFAADYATEAERKLAEEDAQGGGLL